MFDLRKKSERKVRGKKRNGKEIKNYIIYKLFNKKQKGRTEN